MKSEKRGTLKFENTNNYASLTRQYPIAKVSAMFQVPKQYLPVDLHCKSDMFQQIKKSRKKVKD